jgi:hypothetical protein
MDKKWVKLAKNNVDYEILYVLDKYYPLIVNESLNNNFSFNEIFNIEFIKNNVKITPNNLDINTYILVTNEFAKLYIYNNCFEINKQMQAELLKYLCNELNNIRTNKISK